MAADDESAARDPQSQPPSPGGSRRTSGRSSASGRSSDGSARRGKTGGDTLRLVRRDEQSPAAWEFVQPRCARRRREDLEEVEAMVEAGEAEIARDELVWLLSECPDFLEAHVHLGLIALEADDPKLARGHFGRAYELCLRVLEAAGSPRPLPYALPGNKPFYEAAKGLVHCLIETGRHPMARDLSRRVIGFDQTDPLGIARIVEQKNR